MDNFYDDIINLPHPTSLKHPRMSMHQRAAQFAPFAALNGHNAAIAETARLTDVRQILEEHDLKRLNERMTYLLEHLNEHHEVIITYFVEDELKEGGHYAIARGFVKKWDEYSQLVVMEDNVTIPIPFILDINGKFFPDASATS